MTAITINVLAWVFIPSASTLSGRCDTAPSASVSSPMLLLVDNGMPRSWVVLLLTLCMAELGASPA